MSEIENAYQRGKAEGYREAKEKYLDADAYNEGIADGRESAIDEILSICHHAYSVSEIIEALVTMRSGRDE